METWKEFIAVESQKEYFKRLISFIQEDAKTHKIYPPHKDIFNAFKYTPLDKVKAVLLGQDCYHGKGQAHGLAFSVNKGIAIPPSLRNIFKEINEDLKLNHTFEHGDLRAWSEQGVMLLNSSLTVREGEPNSHSDYGWKIFTDNAIKLINSLDRPIVHCYWGNSAKQKEKFITNSKHLVLTCPHPSPLARGFSGCKHFSKTNNFLIKNNIEPIDWKI